MFSRANPAAAAHLKVAGDAQAAVDLVHAVASVRDLRVRYGRRRGGLLLRCPPGRGRRRPRQQPGRQPGAPGRDRVLELVEAAHRHAGPLACITTGTKPWVRGGGFSHSRPAVSPCWDRKPLVELLGMPGHAA